MININDKPWDKVNDKDIEALLDCVDDETFFFEFKRDDVEPKKLMEEVSALANTYGGYILLGIGDDKSICGCQKWNEERIHTTIHDSITPTPIFDIKRLICKGETIFVIKIEEGNMPPYITSRGKIYERLSSGTYNVKTSDKLSQMYHKREDQLKRVDQKLAITELKDDIFTPNNLFGCIDVCFSLNVSDITLLQEKFYGTDFTKVSDFIKKNYLRYSVSKVGDSYTISIGESKVDNAGKPVPIKAGVSNFMEIMADGSVKCRVLLIADRESSNVNINTSVCFLSIYKEIYEIIFGEIATDIFISALKYEKLTVLKQFIPYYDIDDEIYLKHLNNHKKKYGNNLILESNRIPKVGFYTIDKRYFNARNEEFNNENLLWELFAYRYYNLGYIDLPGK